MVSVLVSSAVYRGHEPRWGETKDYKFGMCCFSVKYAALRSKRKDWSAQNRGFEPRSGQTKDYKISICCISAKNATLRRKGKDWLAPNKNIVPEMIDMSIRGLLCQ